MARVGSTLRTGIAALAAAVTPRSARGAAASSESAEQAPAPPPQEQQQQQQQQQQQAQNFVRTQRVSGGAVARDSLFAWHLSDGTRRGNFVSAAEAAACAEDAAAAAARESSWVARLLTLRLPLREQLVDAAADAARAALLAAWALTGAAIVFAALWRVDDATGQVVRA